MSDQAFKNFFQKGQKEFIRNSKCCTEFSYLEDSNLQNRQKMEDYHLCVDAFTFENTGLFAIFDGHGGQDVARFCKEKMPQILRKEIQTQSTIEQALNTTFNKIDGQLKLTGCGDVGSTACVVYIQKSQNETTVNLANVGDTRAVFMTNRAERVSIDHKGSDANEKQRVKQKGGDILNDRLMGTLAITRAFGDWNLKSKGLTAEPYQHKIQAKPGTRLVIASDGVWDVISDEEAYALIQDLQSTEDMTKCLVYNAIQKGSRDNISCLVIKF